MLLKDICEITSGQNAPQKQEDYTNDGYPFIKVSNLDLIIEEGNENSASRISSEAVKKYKLKLYPANSIIFAKSGLSCVKNRVYMLKNPAYVVNHLCVLYDIKKQFDPEWLAYFIKAFDVTNLINDFSYPSIQLKEVGNINIPEIDLNDQKKIVREIHNIESCLSNKRSSLKYLDDAIKSKFNSLFSSCEKIQLCEIAKITMGQSPESASYNDEGNGMPFFQGKADYGTKFTIVKHWTTSPKKIVEKGVVLMSVRAPVGPVNISSAKCCIGRGLCGIDAIKERTNNEFLFNALKTMEDEIAEMGNGSTFKAINKDDVYKLLIPNAPINVQNEFSKYSENIDGAKEVLRKQIGDLEELLSLKMFEHFIKHIKQ